MRWKKPYYIATNISSRKGATTSGDLPDCSANPDLLSMKRLLTR